MKYERFVNMADGASVRNAALGCLRNLVSVAIDLGLSPGAYRKQRDQVVIRHSDRQIVDDAAVHGYE